MESCGLPPPAAAPWWRIGGAGGAKGGHAPEQRAIDENLSHARLERHAREVLPQRRQGLRCRAPPTTRDCAHVRECRRRRLEGVGGGRLQRLAQEGSRVATRESQCFRL